MAKKFINLEGIVNIDYTKDIMSVEFGNGNVYEYHKVPYGIYSDFLNSNSKTKFVKVILNQYYHTPIKPTENSDSSPIVK
jgi:hypothetical protein